MCIRDRSSISEDSGARIITQTRLLSNASDIEGDALTATSLTIASGNGSLVANPNGTWSYTPAANDDTDVTFSYNVTDSTDNVAAVATLGITPVNDAPQATPVVLTPVAEDSVARTITQAELLTGATDIESDCLLYTSPSPRDATLSRMPSSA